LPRIFEIFTQVDRALDRSQGGLGIGLTLVQRLVELHGGTVEARSQGAGRGSEFTVRLPLASSHETSPESEPARAGSTSARRERHRILVVDDNRDSANSMCKLLTQMGHTTFTAYDGLDAVEKVGTLQPDVVLLDIGLPKLNGYEVARRLRERENGRGIVLIAVTGWGQEEDRRRSKDAGFDEHLTKPVEYDALAKILAKSESG
jgi:CheY-like chemotaxis protein